MIEIWKTIDGFGDYEISSFGNIKSIKRKVIYSDGRIFNYKEKFLKPQLISNGYLIVMLRCDGKTFTKYVHQLVAMAFLNHKPCGYEIVVDHIDNNRLNNNYNNLQLTSQRKNTIKDTSRGVSDYVGVSWCSETSKWRASIYYNGKKRQLGRFINEIDAHFAYQKELLKL